MTLTLDASIMDVVANPKDPWAWAGVIGDAVDLIPVLAGVGEAVRGLKVASNAVDNLQTFTKKSLDAISEAASSLNKGCNTVYVSYSNNIIEYVGITNDFGRKK